MLKKKSNLRNRILQMCLICLLLAILLQTLFYSYYSYKLFTRQAVTQNENALKNLQSEIYSAIKTVETDMVGIYNQKMLMRDMENGLGIDMLKKKYNEEAYSIQHGIFTNDEPIAAFYLYDKRDQLICSYQKSRTHKYSYPENLYTAEYDVNQTTLLNYIVSDETAMMISSYYNKNCGENILRFALKIYKNSDTKRVVGYEVCDVSSTYFTDIMKKYMNSDKMVLWLQPRGDRQAVSIGKLTDIATSDYYELIQKINRESEVTQENTFWAGYHLYQQAQNKYNLNVYALMPQRFLNEGMKLMVRTLLISGVIMFFLAALISSTISARISSPVEHLIETINRIRGGNPELRVDLGKQEDEIQALGRNFNEMMDEIQELMAQKYQTQLLLNRAEYQTLQAQINPHFLYNTLDTMGSIANVQKCEIVSSMSHSLANIFRYTLNMSDPLATVTEEVSHVRNYVYVMDIRIHSKIEYEFQIDKETYLDMLPRISIEPLIENALSHGLKNCRKKDRKVTVRTEHLNGELWVSVEDNGTGCDPEEIRKILDDDNYMLGQNGKSIGLTNINSRLKKLFGAEYGIIFDSEIDVGTKVMIHVPILNQEDAQTWLKKNTGF